MRAVLRRTLIVLLSMATGLMFYLSRLGTAGILARERGAVTLISRTHTIDKIYQSMQGPYSEQTAIVLSPSSPRHVVWITGLESQLVDSDGTTPISREFFCHSNLTFTPNQKLDPVRTPSSDERLFTLIPGRLSLQLPEGFAIPIWSDESLDYFTMSLNLNHHGDPVKVRFRTQIHFRDDADASQQLRPLFRRAIYAFEPVGKQSPHVMCMGGDHPGMGCGPMIGKPASNAFIATLGKTNTIHWLIPPGDFESRVPVNDQLDLPYDTTAHYVTGHLHPFGKSLALIDKTTHQTLFTIAATDFTDKLGVAEMTQWSSTEGVELHKDHQYELVTTYHNPTDHSIDAMSILYVYAFDKRFTSQPGSNLASAAMRGGQGQSQHDAHDANDGRQGG